MFGSGHTYPADDDDCGWIERTCFPRTAVQGSEQIKGELFEGPDKNYVMVDLGKELVEWDS